MKRKLLTGETARELYSEVYCQIHTKCADKWVAVDLETGDVWRYHSDGWTWRRHKGVLVIKDGKILATESPKYPKSSPPDLCTLLKQCLDFWAQPEVQDMPPIDFFDEIVRATNWRPKHEEEGDVPHRTHRGRGVQHHKRPSPRRKTGR